MQDHSTRGANSSTIHLANHRNLAIRWPQYGGLKPLIPHVTIDQSQQKISDKISHKCLTFHVVEKYLILRFHEVGRSH
jgi:hypothetical protein